MVGFVGLLSCALAAIFLVLVVLFLTLLQAQLAPSEGNYKLATESGLVYEVEGHHLSDETFAKMMTSYSSVHGLKPAYITTSCLAGKNLDTMTAKRYATYNFVFLKRKQLGSQGVIAHVDHLPDMEGNVALSGKCYIAIKTEEVHKKYLSAPLD